MSLQKPRVLLPGSFPKLVRDRIPEIIKNRTGKYPKTRAAVSGPEYLEFLVKKLMEESVELAASINGASAREELADVFEVIEAILKIKKWPRHSIVNLQKAKAKQKGKFNRKFILLKKPKG